MILTRICHLRARTQPAAWPIQMASTFRTPAHTTWRLSLCLSIYRFICLSVCLPGYFSVSLQIYPFIWLSICPFIRAFVCLSISLSDYMTVCLVCSACLPVCPFKRLFVHLPVNLCVSHTVCRIEDACEIPGENPGRITMSQGLPKRAVMTRLNLLGETSRCFKVVSVSPDNRVINKGSVRHQKLLKFETPCRNSKIPVYDRSDDSGLDWDTLLESYKSPDTLLLKLISQLSAVFYLLNQSSPLDPTTSPPYS